MNILHVSLGLPPFRSGGLTKYSVDLMLEQIKLKHNVSLLYPGRFKSFSRESIIRNKKFKDINVFEIINPLPIPLLNGINNFSAYMKEGEKAAYKSFLEEVRPDLIHVHTLMGIHLEFFKVAKELDIKIIFTTHDYFGLCPKVNLMDSRGEACEDYKCGGKCIGCNLAPLSLTTIKLMQSNQYRYLKNNIIIKGLRNFKKYRYNIKHKKIKISINKKPKILNSNPIISQKYVELRKFYLSYFHLIDYFHFNSTIAKEQFDKYLPIKGKIIPISHSDIRDQRTSYKSNNDESKLKISYLGPIDTYKGFYLLEKSLKKLLQREQDRWHLNVYGDHISDNSNYNPEYFSFHGRYQYDDLKSIFSNTDVLVVPSVWKETFGFIGLEAFSYGVPIIVSENVGFKDIIENGKTGIVFNGSAEDLSIKIERLINNRELLNNINRRINRIDFDHSMKSHTKKILNLYNTVKLGEEK